MGLKTKHIEDLFDEGYSFVDMLPYDEYCDGVFINTDGSLGKVWEFPLIDGELKDDQDLLSISNNLELILQRAGDDSVCFQLILCNDSHISGKLALYNGLTSESSSSVIKECAIQKTAFIQSGINGFFNSDLKLYPKRIRAFLTARYFPAWVHPSWKEKVKYFFSKGYTFAEHFQAEFIKHKAILDKISEKMVNVFDSCGLTMSEVNQEEFIFLLYRILNPHRSLHIASPNVNLTEPIRDQILYNAPEFSHAGWNFEGHHTRVISIKELPYETFPGMFSLESSRAGNSCLLDLIKNFMIVVNFSVPDQDAVLMQIKVQKSLSFIHSIDTLGDQNIEALEKKQDFDETIKELYSGGQKIVLPRVHFVLMEEDLQKAEKACDQLSINLNRLGCEGVREDIIGSSLFMTCLPLNFDNYYDKYIRREKRVCSKNLSDMFPCYGAIRGTKTPAQIYLNRRGEIVNFDPFDSNTNPHGILIGSSGSGKSFFCADMICQQMRLDSYCFVLDKGESYKKLCKVLGGQYISFDLNNPLTINPFFRKPDSENIAFLVEMISQMASGGDERDRLTREDEGLIQKAIQTAYQQYYESREVVLTDVVRLLRDRDFNLEHGLDEHMGKKIALKLEPFTGKGAFGKFFDGKNEFDFNNRLTVFELANLSSHADLQLVVLLNIMNFISNFVSSAEMKPKRKLLLIDEAWSLLKLKNTANFITNAFKTFRKYRCSTWAITQELDDLTTQESGIAILANAANKIILKLEDSIILPLVERMSLNSKTGNVLRTLKTFKGRYSEALIITDSTGGVIRLITNPFLYWLANTEPVNNERLGKVEVQRGNLLEAIQQCAKEYPYGL